MPAKLTTEDFVNRARVKHGSRYDYSKVRYEGQKAKVAIACKTHGVFLQSPDNHLAGQNCPSCNPVKNRSTDTFVKSAKAIHGKKYDYEKVTYRKNNEYVTIICKQHGEFEQLPSNHLLGYGCKLCANVSSAKKQKKDPNQFISEAREVHGDSYKYNKCRYLGQKQDVTVTCTAHGDFTIMAGTLLLGSGCPKCRSTRYSAVAIRWIEEYAKKHRLKNVQHGHNGGEFRIPGTRYRVDGFHAKSNTVFEFYGDRFHGNPKVFAPKDKCHPFKDVTAAQLYRKTLRREEELKSLGYRVISIWEAEYRKVKRLPSC